MRENFSYAELREIVHMFAEDGTDIDLRMDVVREILNTPEMNQSIHKADWDLLDERLIRYYAMYPDRIAKDPRLFRINLVIESREMFGIRFVDYAVA